MKTETLLRIAFRLAGISYPIMGMVGVWIGEKLVTSVALAFFGVFIVFEYLIWRNEKKERISCTSKKF